MCRLLLLIILRPAEIRAMLDRTLLGIRGGFPAAPVIYDPVSESRLSTPSRLGLTFKLLLCCAALFMPPMRRS